MTGPRDRLYGHTAFDFNHDGKIDAAEWAFIDEVIFKDEDNGLSDDDSDDYDSDDFDGSDDDF